MKGGSRKRCRCASLSGAESSSTQLNGSVGGPRQMQSAANAEIDSPPVAECGIYETGSSRSSVHLIHQVVSKFDAQKIRLVEETGFHGILNFPFIKQFNRRFCLWLMSCVDPDSHTLRIGEHIIIKFNRSDVGHVLGIPSNGKTVIDSRISSREAKERVLNKFLGSRFKEHRSVKLVQEIIVREYSEPMSQAEADTFKVAFIVFVASILLAPAAKHDYPSIDYWNALSEPALLHTYDWGEYVVVKLVEAVVKLREDLASNVKFPMISGCCIFLQVLYLDSLELDGIMLRHNTFPRIREFSYDRIRLMISEDRNFSRYLCCDDDLPFVKLRDPVGCVYSWAVNWRHVDDSSCGGALLSLWECVVAMVQLLDVPLEAAGPLFVAAADFQEKVNSGLFVSGTQVTKLISVLVSIKIPYRRRLLENNDINTVHGCASVVEVVRNGKKILAEPTHTLGRPGCGLPCGQCSVSGQQSYTLSPRSGAHASEMPIEHKRNMPGLDCVEIGDHAQRYMNPVPASFGGMPEYLDVNKRVASAMSQFYSVLSSFKLTRTVDLNSSASDDSDGSASSSVACRSNNPVLPSPWELGYRWINCDSDIASLSQQLRGLREYDGIVIVHRMPKYIQISGKDLHSQAVGDTEMEQDLFDVLVRTVCQEDDMLYTPYGEDRWRRVLESDFMVSILSGSIGCKDTSHLAGPLSVWGRSFESRKSRLIFFPALLQCTWVCFVWDLEENVIFVFEPSQLQPVDKRRALLIERSCHLLKFGLDFVCCGLELPPPHHPQNAVVRLLTLPDPAIIRSNRTGAMCYMFCCCFDGTGLVHSFNKVRCFVTKTFSYTGFNDSVW